MNWIEERERNEGKTVGQEDAMLVLIYLQQTTSEEWYRVHEELVGTQLWDHRYQDTCMHQDKLVLSIIDAANRKQEDPVLASYNAA